MPLSNRRPNHLTGEVLVNISIKKFDVKMEIKNNGVEFEVRNTKKKFLGDFIVTKTGLIWCKGRTKPANGKKVSWNDFIDWMQ